jgi:hypothetical protein
MKRALTDVIGDVDTPAASQSPFITTFQNHYLLRILSPSFRLFSSSRLLIRHALAIVSARNPRLNALRWLQFCEKT